MSKKKPGRPFGSTGENNRKQNTINLHQENWDKLDLIGPSRGRAIERLLNHHEIHNISDKAELLIEINYAIGDITRNKNIDIHFHIFQNNKWNMVIPNNVYSLERFKKKVNRSPQLLWK